MSSVAVPVDDGPESAWAVERAVELCRESPAHVHLINVRAPLPEYVARFLPAAQRAAYHRESGLCALAPAAERLDACGVPHTEHVLVGQKAPAIVAFAREHGCGRIIVARPHRGLLANLGLGSIGAQIRHLLGAGDFACEISEVF